MSAAQDEFNELMRDKERRSGHPEDDARSFLSLTDDEDDTPNASRAQSEDEAPRPSMSQARHVIPTIRFDANTGPKGVIADAQNWRDARRNNRISLRSTSSLASRLDNGLSLRELNQREKANGLDEEDDEDDDHDDDFMAKWRQSRLKELQVGGPENKRRSRERSRNVYGHLTAVDGDGYLDAIEKVAADVVVVVYIYDDMSGVSSAIEDCIRPLARKHKATRFVKLHYQDAEMEPAGVPAILAYRAGDKFAGLVPVLQEIPDDADLSASTLEVLLRRFVKRTEASLIALRNTLTLCIS